MRQLTTDEAAARQATLSTIPMVLEKSKIVLRHWLEIAGTALAPSRDDVDPARMMTALPNVGILHIEAPDRPMFRLAGTEYYAVHGRELTGTNYLDLVAPERRNQASERLRTIVGQPCGMFGRLIFAVRSGAQGQTESLVLPLVGRGGSIDMVLFVNERLPNDFAPAEDDQAIDTLDYRDLQYLNIGAGIPLEQP
ncbi:MAG: PAS domain-containing protein [Thalassobaculaceae bacterium]|nr:PAS domain-containing protein [Thalassobaculaceae bacterium]